MTNIVSLRGHEIRPPGEPYPEVIELAQDLLQRAQAGEIKGLFTVLTYQDDSYTHRSAGILANGTLGACARLKSWMIGQLDKE